MHILGSARSNNLIDTVLDDRELASVEDHADLGIGEIKLFIARSAPREL